VNNIHRVRPLAAALLAGIAALATVNVIHAADATVLEIANIDGTGTDDLIVHFAGYGIWSYRNHSTWAPLNPGTPTAVRSGDIDGNGLADLLMTFGSQGT